MTRKKNEDRLKRLAVRINEQYDLKGECARKGFTHIVKLGLLLSRAKREEGHGHFTLWIEIHCRFTPRMAQNYMYVAKHRKDLNPKSISDLTLTGAIKLLRKSNSPDKNRENKDTDPDRHDALAALNKLITTTRQSIQRIEKKQGWLFWRRGNNKMLKRVEENAVALIILLTKRFSIKSRGKSK